MPQVAAKSSLLFEVRDQNSYHDVVLVLAAPSVKSLASSCNIIITMLPATQHVSGNDSSSEPLNDNLIEKLNA